MESYAPQKALKFSAFIVLRRNLRINDIYSFHKSSEFSTILVPTIYSP